MFHVLFVYFYVQPDMVLSQRQVFIIVSDWEPYLGSLGFTVCLWVIVPVYVFSPDRLFRFSLRSSRSLFCSVCIDSCFTFVH